MKQKKKHIVLALDPKGKYMQEKIQMNKRLMENKLNKMNTLKKIKNDMIETE